MKFTVPKIIKQLDLREYAPEMETTIDVWVNPPRAMMMEFLRLRTLSEVLPARLKALPEEAKDERRAIGEELNQAGRDMAEWHATIWSQGPEEARHWTADEIETLINGTIDTDPALWFWLLINTQRLIAAHRNDIKKA